MAEPQTYSDFFEWLITRKASSTSEVRDWYTEYSSFVNEIDAEVKLNRIKAVFQSDTTPETLVETNSNSLIFNGTVLATQVYNLPVIDSGNVGMIFRVISDSSSNAITMLRTGSDVIHVNGVYHGTAYSVSGTVVNVIARSVGMWEIQAEVPTHASTHENGGSDEIDVTGLSGLLADGQTPAAHATSHDVGGADELDWSYDDTLEPTGFTDPDNIDVSYDPTARTITLTGTVKARYKNEEVTALVSGWTSAAHTATPTGTLFLKYDGSAFSWSYSAWGFDQLQIAIVVFTATGTFLWAQREVHSFMDWRTHRSEHNLNGTYRESGGDFAGYVLASTTATERRPTISACQIYDEDLPSLVTAHTSKNSYTLMHFADASGTPILTTGSAEITNLNGVIPQYNEWTGSTWQLSNIANNRYVSVWTIAVPVTSESGSQLRRYIHWTGQTTGNLAGQRALAPRDLDFGLLSTLAPEFILIQQTILKRSGGNWEWEETIRLEGTLASSVSSPSGSFLSAVSVDDLTVKGDGTPTNALVATGNRVITTVSTATYTALSTDQVLDVQYDGPVEIELPDTELAFAGRLISISDRWRQSASVNNITVVNESGDTIAIINASGTEIDVISDATEWS